MDICSIFCKDDFFLDKWIGYATFFCLFFLFPVLEESIFLRLLRLKIKTWCNMCHQSYTSSWNASHEREFKAMPNSKPDNKSETRSTSEEVQPQNTSVKIHDLFECKRHIHIISKKWPQRVFSSNCYSLFAWQLSEGNDVVVAVVSSVKTTNIYCFT